MTGAFEEPPLPVRRTEAAGDPRGAGGRDPRRRSWLLYWIGDPLAAVPACLLLGFSWLLPTPVASAIGGWIGRQVARLPGPRQRICDHLHFAMPELDAATRDRIARRCLDHVGRLVMETPHLKRIARKRTELFGFAPIQELIDQGKAVFCASAHIGNWEVGHASLDRLGIKTGAIYRRPNNRIIDWLLTRMRRAGTHDMVLVAKGDSFLGPFRRMIRDGRQIFVLLDQRFADGPEIPLFGRPALTNTLIAELALRLNVPIYFGRLIRLEGARHRLEATPPVTIERTGNIKQDAVALMTAYNRQIEAWIREYPEQWLWSHRRWRLKKKKKKGEMASP